MKLTPALVKEVISQVVGEDALPIVEFLKEKRNISEFQIADKLKLEVNHIRNILYRLHTHHLITYHRRKDKIKGWYISYWTLNLAAVKHVYRKQFEMRLDKLKERLDKEQRNLNAFYMCKNMCTRTDLDTAMDLQFHCPECGELMEQQDNAKTIENIKGQIQQMENEIAKISA
jgi:transcription initiation factor TFIIE subunit alpha